MWGAIIANQIQSGQLLKNPDFIKARVAKPFVITKLTNYPKNSLL